MEFEDKNLKAAVKKAAKVLKVPEETLKYEVISYGSTGIFGLVGAKKAKIRVVTAKNGMSQPKKAAERNDVEKKVKAVKKPPEQKAEAVVEKKEKEDVVVEFPAEAVELGKTVIQKIVDKITEDATVRVEKTDENIVYHVEGGKTALIIGKRGQTLEAIQYLVDRIVNRTCEKRIRLQIDVAGYLEGKKANLEQRALHLAEKVKKTGKPVTVGELNVYDRKIVHVCLKEERGIRTQSMGSGFYRKLVIFPKKGPGGNKEKAKDA